MENAVAVTETNGRKARGGQQADNASCRMEVQGRLKQQQQQHHG